VPPRGAVPVLPRAARGRHACRTCVSFATGALLGAALLALHAARPDGRRARSASHDIGIALLVGILLFFVLEKFLLWRHCHSED
jgi:zinc and cadmium transporter